MTQYCDSIISTLLFALCKFLFKKKRSLKFDPELSARLKKATVYAVGCQRTGRILLAKFWCIFLEAEVEAEAAAVCRYTASTSLITALLYFIEKLRKTWRNAFL